jgi:AcrR family transcriptional regulator
MARTVKPVEYAAKRDKILGAVQHLVVTKGFDSMTIQDVLADLRISSGAFYHYFDSKPALLEALVERMKQETEKALLPIVNDPRMTAVQKLQAFFDAFDQLRTENKTQVIALLRVWYTDGNALVRQKVDEAVLRQRIPLLTRIVRQGIQEGVFATAYPDQAEEVVLSLGQSMGNAHAGLLLSLARSPDAAGDPRGPERDERRVIQDIVSVHAAYQDAIERILGAPKNSLRRTDATAAKEWVTGVRPVQEAAT